MSVNQGKIHQKDDSLPSNGEDGNNLLHQTIGTGHEDQGQDQQVSKYKKTHSNVLGKLQGVWPLGYIYRVTYAK